MTQENAIPIVKKNIFETLAWQRTLYVCGIDEVGRGSLAGPLVTAAAVVPQNTNYILLKDSKILSVAQREKAGHWIKENCWYAIALCSPRRVDTYTIYQATLKTMKTAFLNLVTTLPPHIEIESILVDAMPLKLDNLNRFKHIPIHHFNFGERFSSSIAAASIIAKVTRDALLKKMAQYFPMYNTEENKGYGTKKHVSALGQYGAAFFHRRSFLSKIINKESKNNVQKSIF